MDLAGTLPLLISESNEFDGFARELDVGVVVRRRGCILDFVSSIRRLFEFKLMFIGRMAELV